MTARVRERSRRSGPGPRAPIRAVRVGGLSVRTAGRSVLVGALLAVALVLAVLGSTFVGEVPVPADQVVRALVGSATPPIEFVVLDLRLARAVCAAAVGAALGAAGAAFQSLTRNPLGSPDVIGFTSGAATGALLQILVVGGTAVAITAGAALGGLAAALFVFGLSLGRGPVGYRLVLVGIGLTAVLSAVNAYLLVTADLPDAMSAQVWLVGSLNGRTWAEVWPVLAALAAAGPVLAVVARPLGLLEMGEDAARAVGVAAARTRVITVVAAVGLTAAATATAGPIAFVALAAPQIARRLTGSVQVGVLAAALTGGLLLVIGNVLAQRMFAPVELPVGVLTGALGGCYLVWLLVVQWRRGRG